VARRLTVGELAALARRSRGAVRLRDLPQAADDVRAGDNPYVDPDSVDEQAHAPYAYPPLLAIVLIPATALPDDVSGSSPVGVLVSLLLIACVVGTLALLGVRDWRCYPIALLYPPTLENVEYGAIGPALALLVALAWRYRDRAGPAAASLGAVVALKVFLWPLVVAGRDAALEAAVGAAARWPSCRILPSSARRDIRLPRLSGASRTSRRRTPTRRTRCSSRSV
jgi:hypothetical protein